MRYLIALVILVAANEITASSYETTTEMELHDGNQAKLYWRQVYEGFTTLYKMEIGIIEINLTEHNAIGQPVFDPTNRFIALPYCADDGCQNTVNVFDLKKLIFLSPIYIQHEGQMYLKCKWDGSILSIKVEDFIHLRNEEKIFVNIYKVTDSGVDKIQ